MKLQIPGLALACLFLLGGTHSVSAATAVAPGDLIKLVCPAGATVNDPCRAVYYFGADGKRHAFPNVAVYNSWYADWSGIKSIDAASLASIALGRNVRWRPGQRLAKYVTVPTVYAVDDDAVLRPIASENIARALYGADWAKTVADMPDSFAADYPIGAAITAASEFVPSERLAANPTIDALSGADYRYRRISTSAGDFDAHVITLDRDNFRMKTSVASTAPCTDDCAAKSLADHAAAYRSAIGINGAYFCPPDYAYCSEKTNTFLWPEFDSASRIMVNADQIKYHEAPLAAATTDGTLYLYRDARTFGSVSAFESSRQATLDAAIANYPTLISSSQIVVNSEPRLEENQRTVKATRGGLGWDANHFYLVVAKATTVPDLAQVFATLGATDAMNLDGGGSAAMLYGNTYKTGPGRLLPTAIVFVEKN